MIDPTFKNVRRRLLLLSGVLSLTLASWANGLETYANEVLKLGIMSGDDEQLWEVVSEAAAEKGLDIEIFTFTDYAFPNEALHNKELNANAFQHVPYLDNQNENRGYDIVPVGYTLVAPIGLFSFKHDSVDQLPNNAQVGIPNDPSNGGRGLLLLEAQNLIKLREDVGILPTVADIVENPKNLRIVELDAGIIGRSLNDLDAAVVNSDWAVRSELSFETDRIAVEAVEGNPYRNVIAVRREDENAPWVKPLVEAYQTPEVAKAIEEIYDGRVLVAW